MSAESWELDAGFKTKQSPWWLVLMGGILSIIIGFLLVTSPAKTTYALVVALAIWWIISGIFTLVSLFVDRTAWLWKLVVGVLGIIAGVLILRNPIAGTIAVPATLVLFLGIQGLIGGILLLILGFGGGGLGAIIMGIISLVLGGILLLNWTNPAMILSLIWVAGIFLIIGGIAQIIKAFMR